MQTELQKSDLPGRMQVALRCARVAGNILMSYYGNTLNVETKSSSIDLVTQADKEADAAICEILQEAYPDDTLVTEESFDENGGIDLGRAWVVDPLDGTTNFAHTFPHFCVSIAYVENGESLLGVVFDPFKNELFTAIKGQGAFKNGKAIHASKRESLGESLLATGFPYSIAQDDLGAVDLHTTFLAQTHGIRRAGAAALDLAYVACGRLDGFWELNLAPWDVAAGILLVTEAGGAVSTYEGEALDMALRRIRIVAAPHALHAQMLGVIEASTTSTALQPA